MGSKKALIFILLLLLPLASAQGTPVFETEWGTETGKTYDALTDGGIMSDYFGYPADYLLRVVTLPQPELDHWPEKGLEIRFDLNTYTNADGDYEPAAAVVGLNNRWPAPAVGESVYFRLLWYNDMPPNAGLVFDHGMQSNIGGGGVEHSFNIFSEWPTPTWGLSYVAGTDNFGSYQLHGIPMRTPIRTEWALHRETNAGDGSPRYRIEMLVFDETWSLTEPRWNNSHFMSNYGTGSTSMADDVGILSGIEVNTVFRGYTIGVSGSSPSKECCILVTGFAVSLDDWLGPYVDTSTCSDGATRSCGSDVGNCVSGIQTCNNGEWSACVGEVPPRVEFCYDDVDNDCDGDIDCADNSCSYFTCNSGGFCGDTICDDGETCSTCPDDCIADEYCGVCGGSVFCGVGGSVCGDTECTGTEVCSTCPDDCGACGSGSTCTDGATRSCGSDVGECTSGIQTCLGGSWGSCVGETPPSTEVCDDTLDNDCDTTTDCGDSDCAIDPACTPSCSCGSFTDNACGAGSCSSNEMQQTRSCTPSACLAETQCVSDVSCTPPPSNNPGDVNNDLMVDLADLVMMTLNLGSSGFDPATDINGDGQVNIFDMVVVARNYGNDYSTPAPTGLVVYYDFEGAGSTVTDQSGTGNDGTINGATRVTGRSGGALDFDGTDDYVIIPHSTSLAPTEITIMAWINTPGEDFDLILAKEDFSYAFILNYLSLDYLINSATGMTDQSISPNAWTHLTLTYDGSNVRVYENGVEIYNAAQTGPISSFSGDLYIGGLPGQWPFNGMIDDVRIYNRALTAAEIVTDMNS